MELTHGLLTAVLGIGGVKKRIEPFRYPRPFADERQRASRSKPPLRGEQINTLGGLKQLLGSQAKRKSNG